MFIGEVLVEAKILAGTDKKQLGIRIGAQSAYFINYSHNDKAFVGQIADSNCTSQRERLVRPLGALRWRLLGVRAKSRAE